MPTVTMYTQEGSEAGDIELNETVFGIEPNETVLHESVLMQRASQRQGTHAVKNRGEVRGGGKKPWRQKGTGRARHGSIRSPIWVGGGVTFGPTPRSYGYNMPKKTRRLALKSALSTKVIQGNTIVIDEIALDEPKTKEAVKLLSTLEVDAKALIVVTERDEDLLRATNNLQDVKVVTVEQLNVLDLLKHDKLILTKDAAEKAGEVLS